MAADSAFVEYVCDQLRPWAGIAARRMFSAHGLFRGGIMFALIRADVLYLRTDAATVADFTTAGMQPFRYIRAGVARALDYHEVPADVLDDQDRLADWAEKAFAAALRRSRERAKAGPKGMRRRRRA